MMAALGKSESAGPLETRRALLATALMLSAAAAAYALTPRTRRADLLGPLDLEAIIPKEFEQWKFDARMSNLILDPATQETINRTYTQTLSRTYVNSKGERMMLSIAYGAELTDTGVGLHYPEVCYPAQGFQVLSNEKVIAHIDRRKIKARRLETRFQENRLEPVTYWTIIGQKSEYSGIQRKILEIQSGLSGIKLDALLFRVSSIDKNSQNAFTRQLEFIKQLLKALPGTQISRIAGEAT